jgi:WD40 repeat protein
MSLPLPENSQQLRLSWAKESLACVASVGRGKMLRLLEWKAGLEGKGPPPPKNNGVPLGDLRLPQALVHAGGRFLLQYEAGAILFCCTGPPDVKVDLDTLAVLDCPGYWLGSAALSADGMRVVTGGTAEDRAIRVWNAATGDFEGRFAGNPDDLGVKLGHDREITKVVFARGGILSASADGTIRKWEAVASRYARRLLVDAADRRTPRPRSNMSWLRFANKGSQLITVFSHDPWLMIRNTWTGDPWLPLEEDRTAEHFPKGSEIIFAGASEDGARIAFIRRDADRKRHDLMVGDIVNQHLANFKRVWGITSGRVKDFAVSNDGCLAALSLADELDHPDGRILLWHLGDDEPGSGETLQDSTGCLDGLAFDDKANHLAGCGKGLRVWQLHEQRTSRFYSVSGGDLSNPVFSHDGKRIAAAVGKPLDGDQVEPGGLVLVNLETRETVGFGKKEASVVHGIAWDPSGVRIATAEHDAVRIWSVVDECRLVLTLREATAYVDSIDWSGNGEWVAAGCPAAGAVYLYRGPVQEDREGLFLLRELQRAHPILEHLKAHWESLPTHQRFDKQLELFLKINGDDPGAIGAWAWKLLLPVDNADALTHIDGKKGLEKERWNACRRAVEWAAQSWNEDTELLLLAGIAQYRCEQWPASLSTLDRFVTQHRNSAPGVDDLTVIGRLYLAMACRKSGREDDARRHLAVAEQSLRAQRQQKLGIVSPEGKSVVHRTEAAVELAKTEAQAVFPEKAVGK